MSNFDRLFVLLIIIVVTSNFCFLYTWLPICLKKIIDSPWPLRSATGQPRAAAPYLG
jgi:hypothetical protein